MTISAVQFEQQNTLAIKPFGVSSGFVDDVRPQLYEWHKQGLQTALATLVNYEGSSPRPVGSQLVVNERGEYAGLISGGCVEAALVHEATQCIASTTPRLIRYGKNSDYFDIQLPCGSGIDVLISPHLPDQTIRALFTSYQQRTSVEWQGGFDSVATVCALKAVYETPQNKQLSRPELEKSFTWFSKPYIPRTRVVVSGEGAIFDYFLTMAQLFDVEVCAYSNSVNVKSEILASLDKFSAFVTLSHDHELEPELLSQVLATEAFYIGALGSRKTHQARLELLRQAGISEVQLKRIHGPVGLNIGGRTPPEIALSIMAEIVQTKHNKRL